MADKEEYKIAKEKIYKTLQEITEEAGLDLRMDYLLPTQFQINPHTLELYASDYHKLDKFRLDFCIGKNLGEKHAKTGLGNEIIPHVCIDLLADFLHPPGKDKSGCIKAYHPQARYGVLLFSADHINIRRHRSSEIDPAKFFGLNSNELDFIDAIGKIIDHPDKLSNHLKDILAEQDSLSNAMLNILSGGGIIRSFKKNIFY